MANTIYLLEKANLFLGDADPTASTHLVLTDLQLPGPSMKTVEHTPGGAIMGVNFTVDMLDAMEPTFKLAGFDPDHLKQFGVNAPYKKRFTAYGAIRDKRTGAQVEAKAVIEGRIASITVDGFSPGGDFGHEYAIKEVVAYSLSVGGNEVFAFDFFASIWRVGGVDQNAETNRILRIPGVA